MLKKIFLTTALIGTAVLMIYPCKTLLAEYYSWKASRIIQDPDTDYIEALDIKAETMPAYVAAVEALRKSAVLMPGRPIYDKRLSDLYLRLGRWAESMDIMHQQVPEGGIMKDDAYQKGLDSLKNAAEQDPLNADYHLALAQFYYTLRFEGAVVEKELEVALQAAPGNAALRYAVALQYLLLGDKAKALDQAAIVAQIDDLYVMRDSARDKFIAERRTPEYLSGLSKTYLAKALEIAWRASNKNIDTVRGITPDNDDARAVLTFFMEGKGIDQ